jgi:hypothetical protein
MNASTFALAFWDDGRSLLHNAVGRRFTEVVRSLSPISPSPKGMNGPVADWFNFATPVPATTLTTLRLAAPWMCLCQQNRCADHGQQQRKPPNVSHFVSPTTASRRGR